VEWPGQQQCAVGIVADLRVKLDYQDPDLKGGRYRVQDHPKNIELKIENDLAEFGINIGLPRVLDLFETYGIKATFAVTEVMAQLYPGAIQSIMARGHEVAAHGYRQEEFTNASHEEERAMLASTTRILEEVCGKKPAGWFSLPRQQDRFAGGQISPNTVKLLIDGGYDYLGNGMADDIPYYWVADFSNRRTLLTLPYHFHLDDQFFLMFPPVGTGTGLENPTALFQNWKEEFDAIYLRGRYFPMVVHPYLIGWGNHLEIFEKMILHMKSMPGVWFTTGSECSRYWKEKYPASTALNLEPST
jgi:peptidoglycan/xylan/chitin deacetylase (PgdA/CDA1 family)